MAFSKIPAAVRVHGQGHASSEFVQLVNWLKIVFHQFTNIANPNTYSTVQVLPLALHVCVGFQTELVQHVCAARRKCLMTCHTSSCCLK